MMNKAVQEFLIEKILALDFDSIYLWAHEANLSKIKLKRMIKKAIIMEQDYITKDYLIHQQFVVERSKLLDNLFNDKIKSWLKDY